MTDAESKPPCGPYQHDEDPAAGAETARPGRLNLETLHRFIDEGLIDTVIIAGVDLQGRLFGKRLQADHFRRSDGGTMACAAVLAWDVELSLVEGLGPIGWHTGYHDLALHPDFGTARVIPWFDKTALVLADATEEHGTPIPLAPRTVLKAQLTRARAAGFDVYTASELEFHLLRETGGSARRKGYVGLDLMHDYVADYNLFRSSQDEWFFRQVRNLMTAADVPIESNKPEYGNGQGEVNLEFAGALEMADRHAIYKQGMKELAALNGITVTFMAKPFTEHSGSSCHLHMSLWKAGTDENLFYDAAAPHGMSETMRHFLGGVQRFAPDFFLLYAPYVNSYKRLVPGSFAPTKNCWGLDNRTVAFRVAGHGRACRLENRVPGADVNGYLATAAMLASGLEGIERGLEPLPGPVFGNAYAEGTGDPQEGDTAPFPRNLPEAIAAFRGSRTARGLLGEDVVADIAAFADHELSRYFTEVTDWERRAYLELI